MKALLTHGFELAWVYERSRVVFYGTFDASVTGVALRLSGGATFRAVLQEGTFVGVVPRAELDGAAGQTLELTSEDGSIREIDLTR
jgi:hypothetical protein